MRLAQFQKGAALIVKDHFATVVAASTFAFGIAFACAGPALAAEAAVLPPAATGAAAPQAEPLELMLSDNGIDVPVTTLARTVGALLEERNERPAAGDYLEPAADESLVPGMRVTYRQAVPVRIRVGGRTLAVRSSAATVGDLLAGERIAVAASDDVTPAVSQPVRPDALVRVVRVSRWTSKVHQSIAPAVKHRVDARLAAGTSRVIARGRAGVREMTVQFVKRDDAAPARTVLAMRILRAPTAKIVVRGGRAYRSLAHVAEQGFASAMHFAGSALRMLASAYTAGCYGCTGMTASGLRAGFGVIAVDPSIIPLGTKLFIPGYGRAIAGDTGGAIHGRRIDLGFDSNGEATEWGYRAVTVYLLR